MAIKNINIFCLTQAYPSVLISSQGAGPVAFGKALDARSRKEVFRSPIMREYLIDRNGRLWEILAKQQVRELPPDLLDRLALLIYFEERPAPAPPWPLDKTLQLY
jgi:hypothetical protein